MYDLLNTLGLCKIANNLITGEEIILEAIKSQKAIIVFLANDAGKNTTKRITDKASFYNVKLVDKYSTEELNKAIGSENRKVLAVIDKNFAKLINKKIDIKER